MFNLTFGFYYGRQSDWTLYFSNEFSYFFNRIKVYCLYLKKNLRSTQKSLPTTIDICVNLYFKNVYVILTMYFIFFYCTLKIKIIIIIHLTLWMSFIIRYFAGSFIIRNEESYSIDESSNIQLKVADNKNNIPTPIN